MKVVVVGSTGVIGAAVVRALERTGQHEVVGVSRHTLPALDIESPVSIEEFFRGLSGIEALLCCAGSGVFKPLAQLTDDDLQRTLGSKLLGQVGLARVALKHVADNGSITLTSGILAQRPMRGSAAISLANAGLEGFVRAAAIEAPRGIRVNVVSPPLGHRNAGKARHGSLRGPPRRHRRQRLRRRRRGQVPRADVEPRAVRVSSMPVGSAGRRGWSARRISARSARAAPSCR